MSELGSLAPFEDPRTEVTQPHGRIPIFMMIDSLATGGSERQFATMTGALDRNHFEISLGCLQRRGNFLEEIEDIEEFNLGGGFLTRQAHGARRRLAYRLRSLKISIAQSFDFYSNLMLIPTALWARVPVVVGSQRQLGDLLTPSQSAAQIAAFWLCDRVVCNSQAAATHLLRKKIPKSKIVVIPNGLPRAAFARATPALPRVPGTIYIGVIARMSDPVKNHAGFLRVAARLAPKYPNVEFVMVGDGELRPGLEDLSSRLGIAGRVRFLGDRRDVTSVLAALDISVLFSFSESLPNSVLESMAAGVPVVATRVGGTPELVQQCKTGLLVAPGNEEELFQSLEQLLANSSMRFEFGQQARKIAEAQYTTESIAKQYEELYAEVLNEKTCWIHQKRTHLSKDVDADKLNISIVAPTTRKPGGQSVQADMLLRHWQDDPVISARFVSTFPNLPTWLAWVERVPYLRTIIRMPIYFIEVWRGMRHADVVHIFSASYWSFLLAPVPALLIARLRRKKALINYHSGEARDHLLKWPSTLVLLKQADRVVVPSDYLVNVFENFGLKTEAVPNVVDEQFEYRLRQPLRPYLLCSRGFHPYYSVDLVVRAFAQVQKQFPGAQLHLLGEGSLENQVRALIRDLKLRSVEFRGVVPRERIGLAYSDNDIFINASWMDNMPVSILEAFASGLPVVTTAPDGIRYIVEHERTGLLCEVGDWKALAENVNRLLRETDLALRLTRNAFEESRRYRWEAVRDQWLSIYRSMFVAEPSSKDPAHKASPLTVATPSTANWHAREKEIGIVARKKD